MSKNIEDFNKVMNRLSLIDIHRMLHPAKLQFVFFKVHRNIYQNRSYTEP